MAPEYPGVTLPADLAGMVKRWTADGTMAFRWPTDSEDDYKSSGEKWGGLGLESELSRLNPFEVKAVGQKNEGTAIDAFMTYWQNVPERNINDLLKSFKIVSAALLAMSGAILAYKDTAIKQLAELKVQLDDNERWAWIEFNEKGIDKRARELIGLFDSSMVSSTDSFNSTMNISTAVIKGEAKLYDDIANRFTPDTVKTGDGLSQ